MRQLHGKKFDEVELQQFKAEIQSSCLKHFKDIISYLIKKQILHSSHQEECKKFIEECQPINQKKKNEGLVQDKMDFWPESVMSIWNIPLVQNYILDITKMLNSPTNTKKVSSENIILENSSGITARKLHSDNPANHFLQSFGRIISQDYQPTLEDILNLRTPTIGIINFRWPY
jgi:hypothetical protein